MAADRARGGAARAARPRRGDGLLRRRPRHRRPATAFARGGARSPVEVARDGLAGHPRHRTRRSRPSAFGYIHLGDAARRAPGRAAPCAEFVEKPSAARAPRVRRDRATTAGTPACSWSAPACCSTCWPRWHPDFAAALRAIAADPDAARRALADAAEDRPRPRRRRARRRRPAGSPCVPAASAGTTSATSTPRRAAWRQDGRRASPSSATPPWCRPLDATGLVVPRSGRVVAVVGLDDVVVVDTRDALLVTTRPRAQDVKQVDRRLRGRRRPRPTSDRVGLGRVDVGVLLHERSRAAPLGAEQYCQTPTCFAGGGLAGATGRPVGEGDVLARRGTPRRLGLEPRRRLELVAEVVGALYLSAMRLDVVHHGRVVGDGLVVPQDRVAVLEVVHELAQLAAGRRRCRACASIVSQSLKCLPKAGGASG